MVNNHNSITQLETRRIRDLAQLKTDDFLKEISSGFAHCLENSIQLAQAASLLSKNGFLVDSRILGLIAEEEAAKCLILMDAVRLPPEDHKELLRKHLGKFYDHVAKRIYALACEWKAGDYREFQNMIDNARSKYDTDVVEDFELEEFPNLVWAEREALMYVDYVAVGQTQYWDTPQAKSLDSYFEPFVLSLSKALWSSGCTAQDALHEIEAFWSQYQFEGNLRWDQLRSLTKKCLEDLISKNLITSINDQDIKTIVDLWTYPMHSIDIGKKRN